MPEKILKIKKVEKVGKTSPVKTGRYFEAVGRRKTAVARVRLSNHKGGLKINNKDYLQYFPIFRLQQTAYSPVEKTKLNNKVDVTAQVSGGGLSSQAEAVRHGLARADRHRYESRMALRLAQPAAEGHLRYSRPGWQLYRGGGIRSRRRHAGADPSANS